MIDKIEVKDLQRVRLEPGDTLFYQPDAPVPREQLDMMQKRFKTAFPRNTLVVLAPGRVFVGRSEE